MIHEIELLKEELLEKILILRQTTWYDRDIKMPEIEQWINQFNSGTDPGFEQLQLIFLLSNFNYFGRREIREMLKSIYRDLFKYPLIEKIRRSNGNTKDREFINNEFKKKLDRTRFLGVGNPSESGTHLLYFFRQENNLRKEFFINGHQIYNRFSEDHDNSQRQIIKFRDESIERYIFIDDLCGSGTQAKEYSEDIVKIVKSLNPDVEVAYYSLFSTSHGLAVIRDETSFDIVDCVFELDKSFKCFSERSRYYTGEQTPISREEAKKICEEYSALSSCKKFALGYKDSQLLLGFYHNTPDNVPLIFWYDGTYGEDQQWYPIFKRYHKIY